MTAAFTAAGAPPDLAEQSWLIFGYGIVAWLGGQQQDHDFGGAEPRFDLYLDTLLRGLPARSPARYPRPAAARPPEAGAHHPDP